MNNVNKLKIAVLSVAMFGMMSGVANAASIEGKSSVEIVKGISIAPIDKPVDGVNGSGHGDLYFGKVVSPTASGATLVVDPNGAYTADGATAIADGHPATFQVNGTPGTKISIEISSKTTMTFGDISLIADLAKSSDSVAVDTNGLAHFTVGGKLGIEQNQAPGLYQGVFKVTANY